MECLENSVVGRLLLPLWYVVWRWYEGSGLCRFLRGVSRVWTRWFHGSALMDLLADFGLLEVVRTGIIAIERGIRTIYEDTKESGEFNYGKNVL